MSSANPRKFSRSPEELSESEDLSIFLALTINKGRNVILDAVKRVEYVAKKYKQVHVNPAAIGEDGSEFVSITLEINVGEAQEALSQSSPKVLAALGFIKHIMRDLFDLRPHFVGPPTEGERNLLNLAMMELSTGVQARD